MNTIDQLAMQKVLSSIETYRASALHLSVGNPPIMRVGDRLIAIPEQPLITPDFMQHIVQEWLAEEEIQRLQKEKDIIVGISFENKKRFKASVFYQQGALSATLMLLPDAPPSLASLGLPVAAQQLALVRSGLVLVIGPPRSKRSTTIAACLEYLNQTTQKHIVTIENPIEILFVDKQSLIEQREIGRDVQTMARGLEFTVQEDVDVVVAGELSTADDYMQALAVAGAGKTIFGVMTANSIVTALNRIIHSVAGEDQRQIRTELAVNLVGVINQRCIHSSSGEEVLVAEVMIPNDAVRTVIQQGEMNQLNNLLATSREEGMRSLDVSLQEIVARGAITPQEAAQYATNPHLFIS